MATLTEHTEILPEGTERRRDTQEAPLGVGSYVGEYLLEKVLGSGGGGVVYAATHRTSERKAALKILRIEMVPLPQMIARFVREAQAVTTIRHPNIVEIFEFGELADGRPYYVMELLQGSDLHQLLQVAGRFGAQEALQLIGPVCSAVQAAHDAGIIHRDIKARNVFVSEANGQQVVKLLDFGIAKILYGEGTAAGLTEPGTMLGTALNMPPEQIRGEPLDGRADIYALGVLLYQLLVGQYPFEGSDTRQVTLLHLTAPPPRPSGLAPVSPAVDAVVLRCLEKLPERRFASASDMLAALKKAVRDSQGELANDTRVTGLGLYFEVVCGEEEMDDALFEDVSIVLEIIEQELAARGYELPLKMSNGMLGIRLCEGEDGVASERALAESTIEDLRAVLAERDFADPRIRVAVSMAEGEVLCRGPEGERTIHGGSLLKVLNWAEAHRVP